jgi:aminomethyltransferase
VAASLRADGAPMPDDGSLRRSPLDEQHKALKARMVPFAGWSMPLRFAGILEEHRAVRNRVGLFDVSHIGRLYVSGADAAELVSRAGTYDARRLEPGHGHYSLLCQKDGGILDDFYAYRLAADRFLVVGNSVNADRDREEIRGLLKPQMNATVEDRQESTVMLALQGPRAVETLAQAVGLEAAQGLPQRGCVEAQWQEERLFVSRTGYTGEDGFELVTPVEPGKALWERLVAAGVQPCGLGARDTLRLEAAFALYGNDIDTTTNPWEAGLDWAVTLDDGADFVGRAVLEAARTRLERHLICLMALGPGIMRSGCVILHGGKQVGRVTSGGYSPTLKVSIAMGYLPSSLAAEGTSVEVEVRRKRLPARVVPRPFYRRPAAPPGSPKPASS